MVDRNQVENLVGQLLFPKETAAYLEISLEALRTLLREQVLTPVKISEEGALFYRGDLDAFRMENQSQAGAKPQKEPAADVASAHKEAARYFLLYDLAGGDVKRARALFAALRIHESWEQEEGVWLDEVAARMDQTKEAVEASRDKVVRAFGRLGPRDQILQKGHPGYPESLAVLSSAPLFLFARGQTELFAGDCIAVVGSQDPSPLGNKRAEKVAETLFEAGAVVVSGGPVGMARQVHRLAFEQGHGTIVVLDRPMPDWPEEAVEALSKKGLVLSSFCPFEQTGGSARAAALLMAGIARATVLIEEKEKGPALFQAKKALAHRRAVFFPQSLRTAEDAPWATDLLEAGAAVFAAPQDLLAKLDGGQGGQVDDSGLGV